MLFHMGMVTFINYLWQLLSNIYKGYPNFGINISCSVSNTSMASETSAVFGQYWFV